MLWQICPPLCQIKKIIKRLVATILPNHHSLRTIIQTVFGILPLFMYHVWKVAFFSWSRCEKGRGSFDYPTEENNKIVVTKWPGNKAVILTSSHWANWCSQTLRSFNQTTCLRISTKCCTFIQSICGRYWHVRYWQNNLSQPYYQEDGIFSFEFSHCQ